MVLLPSVRADQKGSVRQPPPACSTSDGDQAGAHTHAASVQDLDGTGALLNYKGDPIAAGNAGGLGTGQRRCLPGSAG